MVEMISQTVASAAERIASTSYFWGQTSTGPILERRYAVTDFLTKDGNGNVGLGGTPSPLGGYTFFGVYNATSGGVLDCSTGTRTARLQCQGSGNALVGTTTAHGFAIMTASVERLFFDTIGNVTINAATGALGYGTGAGGTVTQATSRTTGVTLNKPCGSITLVSAAGSASWQSFTVTNSLVAATDVIKVCQKSGADKYMIHVTNVAAGSFQITFATTGGTTTEQPVFNFVVERAVTA